MRDLSAWLVAASAAAGYKRDATARSTREDSNGNVGSNQELHRVRSFGDDARMCAWSVARN